MTLLDGWRVAGGRERVAGVFRPDFLAGPGLTLALLGLGFLCAYLAQVDYVGRRRLQGGVRRWRLRRGGAGLRHRPGRVPATALRRPGRLRKPNGALDYWKVSFRVLAGLAFPGTGRHRFDGRALGVAEGSARLLGIAGAGVVVVSMFNNPVHTRRSRSSFPAGLILLVVGLAYVAVSLGICSDNQFVTLTRRELSAYFLSPIGYLVLAGMVLIQWLSYQSFVRSSHEGGTARAVTLRADRALLLLRPAAGHRDSADGAGPDDAAGGRGEANREHGSIADRPGQRGPVVVSKFLATWLFFLLTWLPSGLFLIALRMEVGRRSTTCRS